MVETFLVRVLGSGPERIDVIHMSEDLEYSLCGQRYSGDNGTWDKKKVTCPRCKQILKQLRR